MFENMIIIFIYLMKWILNWMVRLIGLVVSLNGLDERGYLMFVERTRPYFSFFAGVNEEREWNSPFLN